MKIQNLLEELLVWADGERPLDHVIEGINQGRGLMMTRIFNSEKGVKDVKGQGLGKYSNPYAQKRQSRGLQTKVIDFTFTESLFRDIKTVRDGQRVTIAIPSVVEREKVGYLEQRYKREIFALSKDEKNNVLDVIKKNLDDDFNEIVRKYL